MKRDRSIEFRATKRETEYDDDDGEMLPKKIEVEAEELVEKCADRKNRIEVEQFEGKSQSRSNSRN